MHKCSLKVNEHDCYRLSIDNINEVEKWCKGSIKGIKLPIEQQVIELYIESIDEYVTCNIGDWIVRNENKNFGVYSNDVFSSMFIVSN